MAGHKDAAGPSPGPNRRPSSGAGVAHAAEAVDNSLRTMPPDADKASGPHPTGVKVIAASDDPMIGKVIAGRYRIDARLGEGGMGAVYRVEHTHMRKRLALKVLHREMTNQTEIVARFEREAMAAAHIDHPNVAGATDFGKLEDGSCYLVLEYVEGTSLRSQIDKGALNIGRAVHITIQIFAALRRAHDLGIVHRDLKPENVLLVDKDGDADFVKVLDFGIARVPIGSLGGPGSPDGPSLTRAGMVYGTPEYMAPEQALGQAVDGRSDMYGVGVMLFEMLTGRRPYDNKDKVALLGQHVAGPIPSARERAPQAMIPADLDAVVMKLLSKSPSDRYADAAAVIEALQSIGTEVAPQINFRALHSQASGELSAVPSSGRMHIGAPPSTTDVAVAPLSAVPVSSGAAAEAPPSMEAQPPPAKKSPIALVVMGALIVGLIVAVIVVATRKTKDDTSSGRKLTSESTAATGTVAMPSTSSTLPALAEGALKAKCDAAIKTISNGNWEDGMAQLKTLADGYPSEPVVLRSLAIAQSKTKKHVEALGTVKKLVTVSPSSASDPELAKIFDDALTTPTAVESAFSILENSMGGDGARILYDIAYSGKYPSQSARAKKSLADPEVQKNLTPSIRAAIELRAAPGCPAKKAAIEKYRADLDSRALTILKPLTSTRGCGGFFKKDDCWPCLHEKGFLDTVIKEIEERGKK